MRSLVLAIGWVVAMAAAAPSTDLAEFAAAVKEQRFSDAKPKVPALAARLESIAAALAATPPPAASTATPLKEESKAIIDALERVLKAPRAPIELQAQIVGAVGRIVGDGERLVVRAIKLKPIEEAEASMAAALAALAVHRDPKRIESFERYLIDDRVEVVKAAASALGEYFGEKQAVRKRLAGSLVRAYSASGMTVESAGSSGAKTDAMGDLEFRIAVAPSFRMSLAKLTGGVDRGNAKEWETWYRESKDTPWRDGVPTAKIATSNVRAGPAPKPGGH